MLILLFIIISIIQTRLYLFTERFKFKFKKAVVFLFILAIYVFSAFCFYKSIPSGGCGMPLIVVPFILIFGFISAIITHFVYCWKKR
jgi:hypothetical protein